MSQHQKSISPFFINQHQQDHSLPSVNEACDSNQRRTKKHRFSTRIKNITVQSNCLTSTYAAPANSIKQTDPIKFRQKNNEAAKKSRNRKKMYISVIESEIVNSEMELFELNQEIEILRTEIFNALMHTDQVNKQNAEIQSHVIKKLKNLVQETEKNREQKNQTIKTTEKQNMTKNQKQRDTQINICLDSCIYRIGASGSERKAILDILYTGLINRNLPNIYRYILWAASHNTHLFQIEGKKFNQQGWWGQIKDIGEQIILNHSVFLKTKNIRIRQKSRQILSCVRQILHIKKEVQGYGQGYDSILKEIRGNLTPVQFTQLFLFVERSIHKKQLRLFQSLEEDQDQSSEKQTLNILEGQVGINGRKKLKIDVDSVQTKNYDEK